MLRELINKQGLDEQINKSDISNSKPSKLGYSARMMCTSLAALAMLVGSTIYAKATPVWTNLNDNVTGVYVPDEWEGTPMEGQQARRFEQQVRNDSTEGEELIEYGLPVGTDQGVVEAWINDDYDHFEWDLNLTASETILTAKPGYAQSVGAKPTFKLLTDDLDPAGDTVGLAEGIEGGEGAYFQRLGGEQHLPVNVPGAIVTYNIQVSSSSNGSVDKEGPNQVNQGENLDLTFTADIGYVVGDIKTNGVPVEGIPKQKIVNWTWEDIQANGTVDSSYQLIPESDGAIFYFR